MRFAKLGEEVYARQTELVGEELRLYIIIFFHTWVDNRKCNKTLRELCVIYRLDYDNSTRRLKSLRQKKWIENTKKFIRPMVGFKTVEITVESEKKTVEFTVSNDAETVNSTVSNCKNYSEFDAETVNSTVSLIPYIEPFKDEIFPDKNNNEKSVVVSSSSDEKYLSKFSSEECLRYVQIRIERGEKLETPHRFAKWLRQTGENDAFIQALLYPEPIAPQQHIEYSDADFELSAALEILRDVLEMGDEDLSSFEKYYSPELWAKLMGELRNVE